MAAAEQIAKQFGNRNQPAAVIAQIDDQFGHTLRFEGGEGVAKRRISGIDESAQVDVANLARAFGQHLGTIARRNRSDGVIGLGCGDCAGGAAVDDLQRAGGPGGRWSEGIGHRLRAAAGEQRCDGLHGAGAGADRGDLNPAIKPGGEARRAFKCFGHIKPPVGAVIDQADAKARARS